MERLRQWFLHSASLRLLTTRSFGFLWVGETVSQIGDGLNKVALIWFVYQTSGSALRMSFVGVLQTIPALLLGPLIGVYLDGLRKKPTMIVVSLLHGLLVAAIPFLYDLKLLSLSGLYGLVLVISLVAAFYGPALITSIPLMVKSDELTGANALVQSTATMGLLLGPAIAGIGISLLGMARVLYIDAATFLFSVLCLRFVHIQENLAPHSLPVHLTDIVQRMREGIVFLWQGEPRLLLVTALAALQTMGATAFIYILPAFVKGSFPQGSLWLGFFWSSYGAGMLLATISLAAFKTSHAGTLLRILFFALSVGGLSAGMLAFIRTPAVATVLIVVMGWSTAAFNPAIITLVQENSPVGLRTRVITTFNSVIMVAAMLGMVGIGWAVDRVGDIKAMIIIAGVLLIAAASTMVARRRC
jgi:MFS transporter, DHA3 family, macrolide efflux protein